jgi:hypothetical protein
MTIEQILKQRGWTDADLESVKPMLENARFRESLEQEYGAVASERDQFKQLDEAWRNKLDTEYNPKIVAAEKEAQQARLKLAEAQEQLKIAKDYGYLTPELEQKLEAAAASARQNIEQAANGYDPKKHPTWEDVNRFADAEGQAIAMAQDLAAEYAYLTGGRSLYEYEATINGRQMRGLMAIREEAKAVKKPLDVFMAEKFDFNGKRSAMAAQKQKEHDDAIAKATEERVRNEYLQQNPNLLRAVPSSRPFMPAKPQDGKQPWERTAQERKAARITKFVQMESKTA